MLRFHGKAQAAAVLLLTLAALSAWRLSAQSPGPAAPAPNAPSADTLFVESEPAPPSGGGALPVQEMVARADSSLSAAPGLYSGALSLVLKDGRSAQWDFVLYRRLQDGIAEMSYHFSSRRRGLEAKILYLENGEEVWLWDARRRLLARKRDFEKYESVLGSGFAYVDLSGYPLQDNYSGRDAVAFRPANPSELRQQIEAADRARQQAGLNEPPRAPGELSLSRLTITPIFESRYRRLVLIVDPARNFRPLRTDYFNLDNILFKTIQYYYDSSILNRATARAELTEMPCMLESLDLDQGAISRLEFYTFDSRVSPADALFDPEFLNR
ncbi:MAG: hypothetical protein K1X75_02610 [Leptospirales bacterium]|nr:hypothetical protein [Leptospirales bacterium]